MRLLQLLFLVLFVNHAVCAQDLAVIQGVVTDGGTGESLAGISVVVYAAEDHSKPVNAEITDETGHYIITVPPGKFYDIYLRLGDSNPNQRTPEAVNSGVEYNLNFKIMRESSFSNEIIETYGVWIVVAFAGIFFLIVVYDSLIGKRKKSPSVKDLEKQKKEIENVLEIARTKYHKREIDEGSFKQITTDKQQKMIELESKIQSLKGE